ncbi:MULTISPECIES: respiratory nitrate reductase subunit gamma [unclassified Modicisalibacter]|uniref:respiratory nitrate reductase subunit gamma n=1 Tax=unclassified Modicisalibacter TaxID=2679913 RepID=UPI001CCF6421|nr:MULTISPECIES: respiratory nitrate reductase subunit gamma [unclassified Modicisalibacter]MBZ9558803.1 respiratory nitrate reductase subunit gamma [Modicisalibacter sp. R2A 31.J]MBZ9575306.1 respiratory nitrate reductase subunit gamma [Modicisalibacter sp. MOD 31.J]
MNYLDTLLFGLYPYLAGSVFLIGSLLRFDHGQYTWKTGSSQLLSRRRLRLGSNLFHIGVLTIFFGHLVGLLTPHWVYAPFMAAGTKQLVAIVVGGVAGVLCLIGGVILLHRRFFDSRVRASSSVSDNLILSLLLVQVMLGLGTIGSAVHHLDGGVMLRLAEWAQSIVFFKGDAAAHLAGVGWIYRLHILLGLTIVLIFPFTRLVHVWSAPLGYLGRRYQIVRRRA